MAASSKRADVPEDRLRLYRRLLDAVPGVAEKSNFGSAYTAVNGNMYSMISKHGVVGIRLPDAERTAFMAQYDTDLFRGDPAWPPAKEFLAVPDDLLERTDELAPYLERSLAYVLTLKPKATKRPGQAVDPYDGSTRGGAPVPPRSARGTGQIAAERAPPGRSGLR